MAGLFLLVIDIGITSYADDSTPFMAEEIIENVIASLAKAFNDLFNWFSNNRLKSNADKFHVLLSTNKPVDIENCDYTIDCSECQKLLVVKIN